MSFLKHQNRLYVTYFVLDLNAMANTSALNDAPFEVDDYYHSPE